MEEEEEEGRDQSKTEKASTLSKLFISLSLTGLNRLKFKMSNYY